ncbi:peptidase S8/S53 domain-containing protein [Zopfochytrium polystomum]|nr:peptidase S8/S53 domain-containing protein [Zopfochytrium polystomum]
MVKIYLPAAAAAAGSVAIAASAAALSVAPLEDQTGSFLHMAMVEFPTGDSCGTQADNVATFLNGKGFNPTIRTVTNTNIFCGVSFSLEDNSRNATDAIKDLGGSVNIFPVEERTMPMLMAAAETSAQPTEAIHTLTGVDKARSEFGLTGKGVTVAVIDSGIYWKHPALGGCFGPGCKVAKGYDFVGDNYNTDNPVLVPDADPLDECSTESHGTHVAGIVAGDARNITKAGFVPNFAWTGVAPDATIAAYRVFGCTGKTGNDVITSAIYRAAADGADIINMSLGSGPGFPDASDAVAVDRVSKSGVIVFASAGNNGAAGLFASSNPAGALGGFSVASFDNVETAKFALKVAGNVFPWGPGQLNSSFASPQSLDIFINNPNAVTQDVQDDGCNTVNPGAAGKAVVLRWGSGCGSNKRCTTAQLAGATACIIYSNGDNIISVTGGSIPTASTSREAGAAILANPTKVVITKDDAKFPYVTGGTISDFSSGGMDAELHMKPDFGAIGGQVYSSISLHAAEAQGYNTPYAAYDGTSMSSPYSAGIAALLLQKRGKISFDDAKIALQNSAVPAKKFRSDLVDSVALQGAGMLNIYNTLKAKTVITPYTRRDHYSVNIKNNYDRPVSYTVTNVGAATANAFNGVDDYVQATAATTYTPNYASLGFGNKQEAVFTTVVAPGATYQVNVKVTPPVSANASLFPMYSGYITVTNNVDSSVARVPYLGLVGNWMDSPILAVRAPKSVGRGAGFYNGNGSPITAGSTVNVTRSNIALFSAFAGTTRNGVAEVVYTGSDRAVKDQLNKLGVGHNKNQGILVIRTANNGPIAGTYSGTWPRNAATASQNIQAPKFYFWSGQVVATTASESLIRLPAGEYKLRLKGLKHFKPPGYQGDEHYHIVETPSFNLVY